MFTDTLPCTLHTFIDKNMNGEDIVMNAMVAETWGKHLSTSACKHFKHFFVSA